MTQQNDENDVIATERGWTVHDHARGRQHCHSTYKKRNHVVWMINGLRSGLWWQTASIINDRYTGHQPFATLEQALDRFANEKPVVLLIDGRVLVDGADSDLTWREERGQFEMLDAGQVHRVSHTDREVFLSKVLEFHDRTGEFAA